MDQQQIYLLLRRSHITVGIVGVIVFWIPIFAKKGGRLHVITGRMFEWCGYYVATTALFTCVRYLVTPHDYAFVSRPDASLEELSKIEFAQFFLTLLAFLAWIFLTSLRNGMRVVRTRHLSAEAYKNWEARFWLGSQTIGSFLLIGYGVYRLATGGSSLHWVSIAVGAMTLSEFKKEMQFFNNPRQLKMSWWYKHMECMLGCGVAFHTAGFVFTTRWYGLEGPAQFVPWVVPAAIGVPLSTWWIRSYRKKFGDTESS